MTVDELHCTIQGRTPGAWVVEYGRKGSILLIATPCECDPVIKHLDQGDRVVLFCKPWYYVFYQAGHTTRSSGAFTLGSCPIISCASLSLQKLDMLVSVLS